jgi:hypothetical protein
MPVALACIALADIFNRTGLPVALFRTDTWK